MHLRAMRSFIGTRKDIERKIKQFSASDEKETREKVTSRLGFANV